MEMGTNLLRPPHPRIHHALLITTDQAPPLSHQTFTPCTTRLACDRRIQFRVFEPVNYCPTNYTSLVYAQYYKVHVRRLSNHHHCTVRQLCGTAETSLKRSIHSNSRMGWDGEQRIGVFINDKQFGRATVIDLGNKRTANTLANN
jgi:hypothetical protein